MPTPSEQAAIDKFVGLQVQMQFSSENTLDKVKEFARNNFTAQEIALLEKTGWL